MRVESSIHATQLLREHAALQSMTAYAIGRHTESTARLCRRRVEGIMLGRPKNISLDSLVAIADALNLEICIREKP